jgi:putative oxidoreductase
MNTSTVRLAQKILAAESSQSPAAGASVAAAVTPFQATLQRFAPLAGRGLLSSIFLLSAAGKLASFSGTQQFMAAKGMPATAFFLAMAILFESLGGLSVLLGYKVRVGALALIVFLIPATLIFHNFWDYQGMEMQMQMTNFLKNAAIMGGLTLLLAFGAGELSIDHRMAAKK